MCSPFPPTVLAPRSARENQDDAEPRFSRILATIAASEYSIHDLSRSTDEGGENLARLNMPLELGMAAAFFALSETAQIVRIGGSLSFQAVCLSKIRLRFGRVRSSETRLLRAFDYSRSFCLVQDAGGCPGASPIRHEHSSSLRTEALKKKYGPTLCTAASKTIPNALRD